MKIVWETPEHICKAQINNLSLNMQELDGGEKIKLKHSRSGMMAQLANVLLASADIQCECLFVSWVLHFPYKSQLMV